MKFDFLLFYFSINILIELVWLFFLLMLIGEKIKKNLDFFIWLFSWIMLCMFYLLWYNGELNNRKCDWLVISIYRVKC